MKKTLQLFTLLLFAVTTSAQSQLKDPKFNVIAFFTAKNDQAHISYVHEANKWFPKMAEQHNFVYDTTSNWDNLNARYLAMYQVVLFLDTRPEQPEQRAAFQKYMDNGGAWMGFHFAAFAMNDTSFPQNWDWYQNTFLGCGQYVSNTWRPTPAMLKVEKKHAVTKGIPVTFKSAPNEWYRWENDLRKNKDIDILVSIDSASFPLGTGPKLHEIWHEGYYPVVWSNKKFKMVYVNMGHNDIDYEGSTNADLSLTFDNPVQSQLILNSLLWLGGSKK